MRPPTRHRRWRPRSAPHEGPGAKVVVACVAGAFVILAVLALPVVVPAAAARTTRSRHAANSWDSPGGAQADLDTISRGTRLANSTRLSPDPVATVRDVSARYTTARLAEIRDEIAKIDATVWKTQADLDRRETLLAEQRRLTRY